MLAVNHHSDISVAAHTQPSSPLLSPQRINACILETSKKQTPKSLVTLYSDERTLMKSNESK